MNVMISVIVPVYRVEAYLEECVESLIHQSYHNIEIILVDDKSPDRCPMICDFYAKKDSRIKVVHKENGGLSDARNAGIEVASGEYISFVDSDDWIKTDTYEKLSQEVKQTQADVICFGFYDVFSYGMREGTCPKEKKIISGKEAFLRLLSNNEIGGYACFKIYRRTLFQNIRFPKGELFEDIAIMPDLLLSSKRVVLFNERLYYYRHRQGSILNSGFSSKKLVQVERAQRLLHISEEQGACFEEAAKHYYADTLINIISSIDTSPSEVRAKYLSEYNTFKTELKQYTRYLSKRNMLKLFLLRVGVYCFVKRLYTLLTVIGK